ncbi:MAG: hypothetical protein Q8Q04_03460 [archaeon]|nr:hypothetical protein [archaeon]
MKERSTLEKELFNDIKKISGKIREYSRSQKELWKKVPYLALEADGRGGYSSEIANCYQRGYKKVSDFVYVDLENGELIDYEGKIVDDKWVAELSPNLNDLDAREIISELEKDIKKEDQDFAGYESGDEDYRSCKTNEEWRTKVRELFGISEDYTRNKKLLEIQRKKFDYLSSTDYVIEKLVKETINENPSMKKHVEFKRVEPIFQKDFKK